MTLFEECRIALSKDFSLLNEKEMQDVLSKFYKYPFRSGNVDWKSSKVSNVDFHWLIKETINCRIDANIYVIADVEDVPIFRTNLLLLLEHIDDVSALSTKVFILNERFLAQIFSTEPPLKICKLEEV